MENISYKIYQIKCLVDGKKYISFAKSYVSKKDGNRRVGPEKTFRDYLRWSKAKNTKQKFSQSLRESMEKYEENQFELTILEEHLNYNQKQIQDRTQELIQTNGTLYPNGFNHIKDYSRNKQTESSLSQSETQSNTTDGTSKKKQITIKYQVYLITCLCDGKKYVGQCQTHHKCRDSYTIYGYERRMKTHISAANTNSENIGKKLKEAIQTHGEKQFKIELLKECETQREADEYERQQIEKLNTLYPNGLNMAIGGNDKYGKQRSEGSNVFDQPDNLQKAEKYQNLQKQIDISSPEKYIYNVNKNDYILRVEGITSKYQSKKKTKEEKYQDAKKTLQFIHETQQQHTSQQRELPQSSRYHSDRETGQEDPGQ